MKGVDKMDWERFEAMEKSLRDQILMTNKYKRMHEDLKADLAAEKIFNSNTRKLLAKKDEQITDLAERLLQALKAEK